MKKTNLLILASVLALSGCSRDMSDLQNYVNAVKARPAGNIPDIPTIKQHPKYTYQSGLLRSPFMPDVGPDDEPADDRKVGGPIRNKDRNREFLESFPLDSLQMVGTLNSKGTDFALIKTADGLLHQVRAGNYMGENDGEVMKVTESSIELREIVPDGLGGYVYRPSEIPLEENI